MLLMKCVLLLLPEQCGAAGYSNKAADLFVAAAGSERLKRSEGEYLCRAKPLREGAKLAGGSLILTEAHHLRGDDVSKMLRDSLQTNCY